MMTIFPFEEDIYEQAGLAANFVGHTMIRDIPAQVDRKSVRRELGIDESLYIVALVPGSRPAEISRILPVMCEAGRLFVRFYPDTRFALPLAGQHLAPLVRDVLADYKLPVIFFTQLVGLAFGFTPEELGFGKEIVPAEPVLTAKLVGAK